jgi:YD repeat-containing protein
MNFSQPSESTLVFASMLFHYLNCCGWDRASGHECCSVHPRSLASNEIWLYLSRKWRVLTRWRRLIYKEGHVTGSLHSRTKYTRKGWQIFKTETTSSVPSENLTFVQSFNADRLVTGTETYDGSGSLISKTRNDFAQENSGATVSTTHEVKPEGAISTTKTVDESPNAATGLSRQSTTKDGRPYSDWLIQRDRNGKPVADALEFADGSFNEREVKPDGTTVEHKYWAPTKTHTYQTTDAHNRVLEVINDSPGDYTKTTFRYDEAGRRTEIANYDRSGKLLRKGITKYQEDANGNWIEEKESDWDVTLGNKPPKLGSVNRRIITYY